MSLNQNERSMVDQILCVTMIVAFVTFLAIITSVDFLVRKSEDRMEDFIRAEGDYRQSRMKEHIDWMLEKAEKERR